MNIMRIIRVCIYRILMFIGILFFILVVVPECTLKVFILTLSYIFPTKTRIKIEKSVRRFYLCGCILDYTITLKTKWKLDNNLYYGS